MAKQTKDAPVKEKTVRNGIPTHGIFGLMFLFVCVSIGYANYLVIFGTSGLVNQLMLIPSTLFVVAFLIVKAIK